MTDGEMLYKDLCDRLIKRILEFNPDEHDIELNLCGIIEKARKGHIPAQEEPKLEPKPKECKMWTKEELWEHLKTNLTDGAGSYSAAVVVAALYKKLYGEFPKIGLSGAQAECADSVISQFPDPKPGKEFSPQSMDAVVWAKEFMRIYREQTSKGTTYDLLVEKIPQEKDFKEAPIEFNNEEARCWANGYNQYRTELLEVLKEVFKR